MKVSQNLYRHLERQLQGLYLQREILKEEFREALELGDEVENAPLDSATQSIEMNESRIAELENLLKQVSPVDDIANKTIAVGSAFTISERNMNNTADMVLTNSELSGFLPRNFRVLSTSTVLGKAVLGASVGDTFSADTPNGIKYYKVISLRRY